MKFRPVGFTSHGIAHQQVWLLACCYATTASLEHLSSHQQVWLLACCYATTASLEHLSSHQQVWLLACCYASLAKLHVAFYSSDSAFPHHQITSNAQKTLTE